MERSKCSLDYGLTIESELPEIVAKPRYNEITVIGSNRVLNEWFGDYEPFDLKLKMSALVMNVCQK